MANWIVIAASLLVGVWLIETVVFVLSYRLSTRVETPSEEAKAPLL